MLQLTHKVFSAASIVLICYTAIFFLFREDPSLTFFIFWAGPAFATGIATRRWREGLFVVAIGLQLAFLIELVFLFLLMLIIPFLSERGLSPDLLEMTRLERQFIFGLFCVCAGSALTGMAVGWFLIKGGAKAAPAKRLQW
jgi:hypothetical protein